MRYSYLILAYDPNCNTWCVPVVDIKTEATANALAKAWCLNKLDRNTDPFWVTDQDNSWASKTGSLPSQVSESRNEIRFHIVRYRRGATRAGLTPRAMYLISKAVTLPGTGESSWYAESFRPVIEKRDDGVEILTFDDYDTSRRDLSVDDLKKSIRSLELLTSIFGRQADWITDVQSL